MQAEKGRGEKVFEKVEVRKLIPTEEIMEKCQASDRAMCWLIINHAASAVAYAELSPQDTVLEYLLQGAAWSYAKP